MHFHFVLYTTYAGSIKYMFKQTLSTGCKCNPDLPISALVVLDKVVLV